MTCKDCIHEGVCLVILKNNLPWADGKYPAEAFCFDFKNKADFVEVVRCKDCKESYTSTDGKLRCDCLYPSLDWVEPENFCSYGKRK